MSDTQRHSPYQGILPYDEKDAPFFFGRNKDTRLIVANLFASPLTLLYGPSGVGKTSVLRAGVAHQLRLRSDLLVVLFSKWQSDPLAGLKAAVSDAVKHTSTHSFQPSVSVSLVELLDTCAKHLDRRIMLILDQFDEYFLYYSHDDEFAVEFPRAVTQAEQPISFLISIREDSLAKLDRFEGRIPMLFDNYLRLERLDQDAAKEAIIRPIEVYNREQPPEHQIEVESDLVDTTIEQVGIGKVFVGQMGRGQIAPRSARDKQLHKEHIRVEAPYLQLVLERLWQEDIIERNGHILRLDTLDYLGGANRIVQTHLDKVMTTLTPAQQHLSARLFHFLVTPSGTKIAHTADDLALYAEMEPESAKIVLSRLVAPELRVLRPITFDSDVGEQIHYEIFHDVLGRAVLDWRSRYFRRSRRLQLITIIVMISVLLSTLLISATISSVIGNDLISVPPLSLPRLIVALARGIALVILNIIVLIPITRRFSQELPLAENISSITAIKGIDVVSSLGVLLTIFWYTSTNWQDYPVNPLGDMTTFQFLKYLITVPVSAFIGLIVFLAMWGAGQLTNRLYKRFEFGFSVAYFGIFALIIILSILNISGLYHPNILRIPQR